MAIKPKHSNIVAKDLLHYNPATFEEMKIPFFNEVTAEHVLENIKPIEFDFLPGRRFISVDTESFYTGVPSNRLPKEVVRRWIKRPGTTKYIPNDFPFCISICDGTNAYVVYDTLANKFQEFHKLIPLFLDKSIEKIGHNFNFDEHMLANSKTNLTGRRHDTVVLSKLTRADAFSHRLIDIANEFEGSITQFEKMLDSYKAAYKITDYRQFPKELMTQYTCGDVWNTIIAFKNLYPMMIENGQEYLYDVENLMLVVAYSMEREGILTDPEYVDKDLIPELTAEVDKAEQEIYDTAGCMFNINSGAQIYEQLAKMGYGHMVKFKKKTGNPILDKDEMARLENEGVPLIAAIQKYKASQKLLNTFAVKLSEMRDFHNIVHCNFNTIEAKTGRFSISSPSMQNMPRRKDDRVRGAFVAPEGYTLFDFDFQSQEMKVLAHYSKCEYLLEMIKAGHDIHVATAAIVYSKPVEKLAEAMEYEDEVNAGQATEEQVHAFKEAKDMRGDAKSVGFAVVYGAGAPKVAAMTKKPVAEAQYIIKTYMHKLPEVNTFINTANKVAKQHGYIKTRLGRRVYTERGREYACVNYAIQGSSAESTKCRMIDIYKFLKANSYKTHMILQVHDSLLQCVDNDEQEFILGYLRWLQTDRELFKVPVTVDIDMCYPTWRNKKKHNVPAVQPPEDQLENMRAYDIWSETLF